MSFEEFLVVEINEREDYKVLLEVKEQEFQCMKQKLFKVEKELEKYRIFYFQFKQLGNKLIGVNFKKLNIFKNYKLV